MPAEFKHTTAGVSEDSELSMIRAVNTGVINVRTESGCHIHTDDCYSWQWRFRNPKSSFLVRRAHRQISLLLSAHSQHL